MSIPVTEQVSPAKRISHFTWPWFATTMSTGSVAVVLSKTPYRFRGLDTIGKMFFILDIILFGIFTILMVIRFIQCPRKIVSSVRNPKEGFFFGAYWVSIALILDCIAAYGLSSTGPWLVKCIEVLFWIYCASSLMVAIGQYYYLFHNERLHIANAMPAWIFPIYPLLVIGPLAGTILTPQSHHNAVPIWVAAVMLQGLAWTVALMMYSMYTQRLMTSMLPAPSVRPAMYVSVGPAGYTAAGLISLAELAPRIIPENALDTVVIADGRSIRAMGILCGTFIILFAFWFFCITTIAVLNGVFSPKVGPMNFTLNWWAFVFPNGGLTLGVIYIGKSYQSPGINAVTSAMTILLVIMWFVTAYHHIKAVLKKEILWPGKDEDKSTEPLYCNRNSV